MRAHLGLTLEDIQSGIGDVWSKPAGLPDVGTLEQRTDVCALEGDWVAYGYLRAFRDGDRFNPEKWRHLPSWRYVSGAREVVYDLVSGWIAADVAQMTWGAIPRERLAMDERVIMRVDVTAPDRTCFTVIDRDVTGLVLRLMTGTDIGMERPAHENCRRMIEAGRAS